MSQKSMSKNDPGGENGSGYCARHASSIRLRRSGPWCRACAARRASPPCADARASPRVCITAGRKSFWKRARSGSPATPGAKRPRARLKACARRCSDLKELVAELSLENRLLKKNMIWHGLGEESRYPRDPRSWRSSAWSSSPFWA